MKKDFKGLLCIWLAVALLASCFFSGAALAETVGVCFYRGSITESTEVSEGDLDYIDVEVGSETKLKDQASVKAWLDLPEDKVVSGWNVWEKQSAGSGYVSLSEPETKGADWSFSVEDAEKYIASGYAISPLLQLVHVHDWSYELAETNSENDTIKAVCAGEDCDAENTALTIVRPEMTIAGEGVASAALSADSLAGQDALPEIYYKGTGETLLEETTTAPAEAGTYRASITVEEVTAYVDYTIASPIFTVEFDSNGGSSVEPQDVVSGEKATKPSHPTRTGYSFDGWYNGDAAYDFDTPVSADLTLTAKWSKKTTSRPTSPSRGSSSRYYMITFDSNGGSAVDGQNIRRNSLVEKPEDPTKEGFTFSGWYTDKELTALYDFEKAVQYGFTLYAKWTQETETVSDTTPYKDVKPNDWFYEDVKFVIEKDLIDGITDSEFGPNVGITRAALVTALYRAEGKPEVTGDYTFEDIPDAASYKDAIVWGQENGIIFGYSETEFRPEQTIIREQIAAIINRYAAYKKYDLSKAENVNILSYADAEEISGYAVPSVQYVVGAGVMEGKTDDTFNPKDDTTRAEMAAILRRFFKLHA